MLFVVVNNEPEVLMRVTGLLRRKGINIKSIRMEESTNPSFAHLTILTEDNECMEQTMTQMEKFVDVHEVKKIDHFTKFQREWETMKTKAREMNLHEVLHVMDHVDNTLLGQHTMLGSMATNSI
ncbi:acetolactate synthase small subunit [Clostridiaceae bacterium 35-E11]